MDKEFLAPTLTVENLDRYYQRTAILKALKSHLPYLKGQMLDVGCGKMPYREFIFENSKVDNYTGLDIATAIVYDEQVKPDYTWDGYTMPFEAESFDCAMATEVLEHCPYPNITIGEIHRVLKPGAPLFFTVPFLWNLHEPPFDFYRYTPFALQQHLTDAGFTNISLGAHGGWHASMAQMLGLWLRRSPMKERLRTILSNLALPFYKKLIRAAYNPTDFHGTMITGLYGIAYKNH